MFKKLNTTKLIIILLVLGGLIAFNKFYQSKKEESTFREEFVKIDSASVTQVLIYPKADNGKEIKIIRNGNRWDLQNDKIKTQADSNAVRGLLGLFTDMKSASLAGEDRSTWKDLQVTDTSGTRIKILTSANKTYNMVIGKFSYNQETRNGLTYIRHADEDAVYAVEGFLSFSVNQGINAWRVKTFINGNKDSWTSLTFSYPADSSFVLHKNGSEWMINDEKADSAKATQYLSGLATMQSAGFADMNSPASTPVYTLTISGNNQASPITVMAYPTDTVQKLILHSSLNSDAYFSESQSHLADRLFVGRQHFAITAEPLEKK